MRCSRHVAPNAIVMFKTVRIAATLSESLLADMAPPMAGQTNESEAVIPAPVLSGRPRGFGSNKLSTVYCVSERPAPPLYACPGSVSLAALGSLAILACGPADKPFYSLAEAWIGLWS